MPITNPNILNYIKELYDEGYGVNRIAKMVRSTPSKVKGTYKKLNIGFAGRRKNVKTLSIILAEKCCTMCGNTKSTDQFRKKYYKNGRVKIDSKCIDCARTYEVALNKKPKIKERRRKYDRQRVKRKEIKLKRKISSAFLSALKHKEITDRGELCFTYLGYTLRQLEVYIEQQFESWMTWNNWGKYDANAWDDNDPTTWKWQLDHIIPQSDLPYASMEDDNFKLCWSLSNLRPYSAKQNLLDGINRIRHKNKRTRHNY